MRLLVFALMTAVVPGIATAADFHWQGRLNPGQTVEIKGINGSIHAEAATGGEIVVDAVKTAKQSDPNGVQVQVVPSAEGVTICAVYPTDGLPNECKPGEGGHMNTRNNDVKVDFTVKVPAGVRFAAKTVNGGIDALNLRSDVSANSVNGKIDVSTTELASAKSVNGGIVATMGKVENSSFKTVNGGVQLTLPANTNADVNASTVNGNISTDFPLTVSGKVGPRTLSGKIGAGGRELKVSTVNGAISLKRGS
jgi:hypothetical protein